MNKIIFIAFFTGGILLIIYGFNASNSLGADFGQFFSGSPTTKSVWLLLGGVLMAGLGAAGLFRKANAHSPDSPSNH